jgi:hypothetical protein
MGEVIGIVSCPTPGSTSGCSLQAVGYLPWAGGWFSTPAVPDLLGLAGQWTNLNGTILGMSQSIANFKGGGQFTTVLGAYNCTLKPSSNVLWSPQPCPPPTAVFPFSFEISASDPNFSNTAETNNLTNGPTTFVCDPFYCWLSYNSVSP